MCDEDEAADEARTLRALLAINAGDVRGRGGGRVARPVDRASSPTRSTCSPTRPCTALALYAVGRPASLKLRAAHTSGGLQLALAVGAFSEVARRAALAASRSRRP